MKLLSINSKFYKAMVVLWDSIKLNFLWILFSLPIFTIGASTIAAYSVTLKMVEDNEGKVASQFFTAFKANFKQGVLMGLFTMIVSYCAYLNFEFFEKLEGNPILFLIAGILIVVIGLVHLTYAFPLAARYKNTMFKTFANSKEIAFKYIFRTILLWIIVTLFIIVFLLNYTMMFIGILVGPISIFLIVSSFSIRIFKKIEKDSLS